MGNERNLTIVQAKDMELVRSQGMDLADADGLGFSPWARDVLKDLKGASGEQRKKVVERVREETRNAALCLARATTSLFETMLIVETQKLYLDMEFESTEAWLKQDVAPALQLTRDTVSKLKRAAQEYLCLDAKFEDVDVSPRYSVLCELAPERRRQEEGKGWLRQEEFARVEREVAAGRMTRSELIDVLRAGKRSDAGKRREPKVRRITGDTETGRITGDTQPRSRVRDYRQELQDLEVLAHAASAPTPAKHEVSVEDVVRRALEAGEAFKGTLAVLEEAPLSGFEGVADGELARLRELLEDLQERAGRLKPDDEKGTLGQLKATAEGTMAEVNDDELDDLEACLMEPGAPDDDDDGEPMFVLDESEEKDGRAA